MRACRRRARRTDAPLLHHALTEARSDEITAPLHCGLQLWDVISVTDAGAGLVAAKRRVAGIEMRYSTGERAVYEERLALQDV